MTPSIPPSIYPLRPSIPPSNTTAIPPSNGVDPPTFYPPTPLRAIEAARARSNALRSIRYAPYGAAGSSSRSAPGRALFLASISAHRDRVMGKLTKIKPKPSKEWRPSRKIREAIALLCSGACKNQKAAAERVGIHPGHLSRELGRDETRVYYTREARKSIAAGTMRASARLLELIDSDSQHVSFDATKHLLAIENIRPPDQGATLNINTTTFVGATITNATPHAERERIAAELLQSPAAAGYLIRLDRNVHTDVIEGSLIRRAETEEARSSAQSPIAQDE